MFVPFSAPLLIGHLSVPSDILFLVVATILGFGYGVAIGRDRAVLVLLSLYVAFCVITNAPIISTISQGLGFGRVPALRVGWFLGLFIVFFLILWRSATLRNLARERGSWIHAGVFGVLEVGFLSSAVLFLLPVEVVAGLPNIFKVIFLQDIGRSLWFIAPMIGVALLGRTQKSGIFAGDESID